MTLRINEPAKKKEFGMLQKQLCQPVYVLSFHENQIMMNNIAT